jgi:peptidoglycan/xylan/chitin deacetylase (PgdA/CDA1 family)
VSAEKKNSAASSIEMKPHRAWRGLVVQGLYRSGAIRLMEKMTQKFELESGTGASWPRFRRNSVPRFAILCYHRVGTGGVPLYSQLPREEFEAQMRYLRKYYRIISLDQLILEMARPKSLEPAVAVTFDDGYRGLYNEALPILQAYQVPSTVFLTVGSIESGRVAWYDRIFLALRFAPGDSLELVLDRPRRFFLNSPVARMNAAVEIISSLRTLPPEHREQCCAALENNIKLPEDQLRDRMLTWDQIRTMLRAGVSFGSHTMGHPVMSRLSHAQMEWEIFESKRILENRLEVPVRHFAFPFGKRDECGQASAVILASAGYQSAVTTEWGLNSLGTDPFQLRRVQIGEIGSLAMFAFQLNRLFLHTDLERTVTLRGDSCSASSHADPQPQRVEQ